MLLKYELIFQKIATRKKYYLMYINFRVVFFAICNPHENQSTLGNILFVVSCTFSPNKLNCVVFAILVLNIDVNVAVYMLKKTIPTRIHITAKTRANIEVGVRSPYLKMKRKQQNLSHLLASTIHPKKSCIQVMTS